MRITLVTVGKIKEKFFVQAIEEYSKRLSRYCKLEIIEVADEKTPDKASEALELQIKEKEGERILKSIKDDSYVIALAIEGKHLSRFIGAIELLIMNLTINSIINISIINIEKTVTSFAWQFFQYK